jgi:hypothetical protein
MSSFLLGKILNVAPLPSRAGDAIKIVVITLEEATAGDLFDHPPLPVQEIIGCR